MVASLAKAQGVHGRQLYCRVDEICIIRLYYLDHLACLAERMKCTVALLQVRVLRPSRACFSEILGLGEALRAGGVQSSQV